MASWDPIAFHDAVMGELGKLADEGALGDLAAIWDQCCWGRKDDEFITPDKSLEDQECATFIAKVKNTKYFSITAFGLTSNVAYVKNVLTILTIAKHGTHEENEALKELAKDRLNKMLDSESDVLYEK